MVINLSLIFLGFWSPWLGPGKHTILLEWLPVQLSRLGLISFGAGVTAVQIAAGVLAALGVLLRVWGSACLGPSTVSNLSMMAGTVVASGPFRYTRNPLYLGLWFMVAALAFLMPPSGALCTIVLISFFLIRLTLGEESFLAGQLGEPYEAYLHSVPRFFPRLRNALPPNTARPQWVRSILAELTPIGIFVAFAFLSWSYNGTLMLRVILVSFGLSLVSRALMPQAPGEPTSTA